MQQQEILPNKLPAFLWHFIKKWPLAFAVFFIAPTVVIVEAVIIPYAFKLIIDSFAVYESNRYEVMSAISPALWLAGLAWLALIIFVRLQEWWQIHVLPYFEAEIRTSCLQYLTKHSYDYFANNLSGNLATKISDLPKAIDSLLGNLRWNIIAPASTVIAALAVMTTIHPLFAAIVALWVVIELSVSMTLVRHINNAAKINAEDKSQLSGRIVDVIANIVSTKLFAKRLHEMQYVQKSQNTEIASNKQLKWNILIFRSFVDLPPTLMWLVMGYMLISYWQKDYITTGDMVFIFNAIWSIMSKLWFLGESLTVIFKDYGTASQALSVILQPHEVSDRENATNIVVTDGLIEFNDVSFHYNKGDNIFENKNLTIQAGQKVGLVGFSGSGKTSFVNLILRFYDVESGAIHIDKQNIADVTQDSLRASIAMIPQDTSLFHRSLIENIRYGNENASKAQIIEISKRSHCHEFIKNLPEGYNTEVGERGIKLSGGQRQRIAIARAMLKNAPILILDEATSALDSMTEKHIQDSLHNLMEGRTTIVIAHRLSTLSEMDRILVFDNGHIIEDGKHEDLLHNNKHYAKMWRMQAGGFLPDTDGN